MTYREPYYLDEETHVSPEVRTDFGYTPKRVFGWAIRRSDDGVLVFRFENHIDAIGTLDRLNNPTNRDLAA